MPDVYFFKRKNIDNKDMYLRVDNDGMVSIINVIDNHIFTALDLIIALKKGIKTPGIDIKTIHITTFINMVRSNKSIIMNNKVVIDINFKYFNNGDSIYVNDKHEFTFKDNTLKIEYCYLDSDRHKEKSEIEFNIEPDSGIVSNNYDHFFYIKYKLFRNFEITKL